LTFIFFPSFTDDEMKAQRVSLMALSIQAGA
jgi:hypothetical protein